MVTFLLKFEINNVTDIESLSYLFRDFKLAHNETLCHDSSSFNNKLENSFDKVVMQLNKVRCNSVLDKRLT